MSSQDCVMTKNVSDEEDKTKINDGATLSKRARKTIKRVRNKKAQQKERYKEMKRQNKPTCRNSNPGFMDFSETEYYFENGLRKVYPYYYEFSCYAKGRWQGRTVLNVFESEFLQQTDEYYKNGIAAGQLQVNGRSVSTDYVLKNKDIMTHKTHRHENPVIGSPLEIICENEDVIVVNKPASIPVHPCGRYRYNSIYFILGKEHGLRNLRTAYRLDRMTSGVLILAKNAKTARKLLDDVSSRHVRKEYVCRVVGEFPEEEVVVDQPIGILSNKIGVHRVSPDGKPSKTTFIRLNYNGKSSVVKCIPHTGRTHQIRVHLQYLGHPIVNDHIYNSEAFGPNKGKGGDFEIPEDKLFEKIRSEHNIGLWVAEEDYADFHKRIAELKELKRSKSLSNDTFIVQNSAEMCDEEKIASQDRTEIVEPVSEGSENTECQDKTEDVASCTCDPTPEEEPKLKKQKVEEKDLAASGSTKSEEEMDSANVTTNSYESSVECSNTVTNKMPGFEWNNWFPDENCSDCRKRFIEPVPKFLIMYLHALKYKGSDWEYEAPMPDWARDDWVEPGD
ncbi:hypothetical protein FSP39_013580 [Pinctada imbricata]|uniref:Pseudouridine synthase RsuA/RluA-like domain-containing protein n=1 Tax=Pinctada imbricata TaxID=66713 RepID=A0AA89BSS6_PINIB|nr:hypothetical protein FSP39_013580 [Pinctada imbricata]